MYLLLLLQIINSQRVIEKVAFIYVLEIYVWNNIEQKLPTLSNSLT